MRKQWLPILAFGLVAVLAFACSSNSDCADDEGCGSAEEDEASYLKTVCKDACQKLVDCDDFENGGTGSLNEHWMSSCRDACEDVDKIAEDVADCLNSTPCADIQEECGTGAN
ncbi:MAG: hypothetical protein C4523_21460 [Myxococcales bacterium]|nr:MAG: hypothetical protein C4523_21460 [Myxococcales bacterium]